MIKLNVTLIRQIDDPHPHDTPASQRGRIQIDLLDDPFCIEAVAEKNSIG
jgi:hypothetical protein